MLTKLAKRFAVRARTAAADRTKATPEDILYCFRLLLGRDPSPEERIAHLGSVGMPLSLVVWNYLKSVEFRRRGLFQETTYRNLKRAALEDFFIFACEDDDIGGVILNGSYEPHITSIVRTILRPGMAFIDVGANIGYFSMLAASIVGKSGYVLAVEPNPINVRLIEASRRENRFNQLLIAQCAAGDHVGLLALHTIPSQSNGHVRQIGADRTELLASDTVAQLPIDNLVPRDTRVHLLKIDAEGAELNALLGASRILRTDRPIIISEFSPSLLRANSSIDGVTYLNFFQANGYKLSILNDAPPSHQTSEHIIELVEKSGFSHVDILAMPS